MEHRFYDPSIGRFLNRDPIGFAGDLNLFRYAAGNPTTLTDHTGLEPVGSMVNRANAARTQAAISLQSMNAQGVSPFSFDSADLNLRSTGDVAGDFLMLGAGLAFGIQAGGPALLYAGLRFGIPRATLLGLGLIDLEIGAAAGAGLSAAEFARRRSLRIGTRTRSALRRNGNCPDTNGFTRAGRQVIKKSSRKNSTFPKPSKPNPQEANPVGEQVLDDILFDLKGSVTRSSGGITFKDTSGKGAKFLNDGLFHSFREP